MMLFEDRRAAAAAVLVAAAAAAAAVLLDPSKSLTRLRAAKCSPSAAAGKR